jgi:hypothetical protein
MFAWLKRLDRSGGTVAWIIALLTAQWGVLVSAIIAVAVAAIAWANDFAHRSEVQTAVIVFLVLLWSYIGVATIARQRKPHDYAYCLLYESITFGFDPDNESNALQLQLALRNVGDAPIQYEVESFDVVIGDRTVTHKVHANRGGYLPRFAFRLFRDTGFKRDTVKEFYDKDVQGSVKFSIAYGPPEGRFVRRLRMELDVGARLAIDPTKRGWSDIIVSESDRPISQ